MVFFLWLSGYWAPIDEAASAAGKRQFAHEPRAQELVPSMAVGCTKYNRVISEGVCRSQVYQSLKKKKQSWPEANVLIIQLGEIWPARRPDLPEHSNWDNLLAGTIETNGYIMLAKDEMPSILFGCNTAIE